MRNFDFAIATKALFGDISLCGDLGFARVSGDSCTAVLIDVLGHGAEARQVALIAEAYLKNNYEDELLHLMQGLHAQLSGSRGAVVALCRADAASGKLLYTGIGNICAKVIGSRVERLVFRDGIVGYGSIRPHLQETMLQYNEVLVMHSDGVRSHFDMIEFMDLLKKDAESIAAGIMVRYGGKSDDASCIVLKYQK